MIDTHCHLNDDRYENVDEIVDNFLCAGIKKVICVGCDNKSNLIAKEIANKFKEVYYTVGIHPDECTRYSRKELENFLNESAKKLLAIGEIGLDYHNNCDNKETQKQVFINQIELANKYNLPVVIHCRDAYGDMLEILKTHKINKGFVFHCYSGSSEFAKYILSLGGKISFTGSVTFKNAKKLHEVAKMLPINSFFFETDSPYLSPEPIRGSRNEPKNVFMVAEFVAKLRNENVEELIKITDKNAENFFSF